MVLINVWAALVALAMILYVVLDGITLGIALLFGIVKDERERSTLVSTILPFWDVNQTWLLFGGGAIFAAFPVVYGVLSSALYLPLITFIAGLIFRGVAFEFRVEHPGWNRAFFLGSLVAVLSQGLTLGGILTGVTVAGKEFAGGAFDWLNPFSVMVAVALVPGYVMLASAYVALKTTGGLQNTAYRLARRTTWIVILVMALVTVWMPYHYHQILGLWLSAPRIYFVWTFPLLGLIAAFKLIRGTRKGQEKIPLLCAILLLFSGYLGLGSSLYPLPFRRASKYGRRRPRRKPWSSRSGEPLLFFPLF